MVRIPTRRYAFLAIIVLATNVVGCRPQGPSLPICSTRITQPPTGDLSVDIVGDWNSNSNKPDDHPAATLYAIREARRLWRFNADGSGYTWSLAGREDGDYYDEGPFTWQAEGNELFISQLPPMIVIVNTDDTAVVRATQEADDSLWNRCQIEEPAP